MIGLIGSGERSSEAWSTRCATATTCVSANGTFLWGVGDEVRGAAVAAGPDVHC